MTKKDITGSGAPVTLLVFNNEVGFSRKNMDSICSVGRSTKKGKRQQGFIGEKGLYVLLQDLLAFLRLTWPGILCLICFRLNSWALCEIPHPTVPLRVAQASIALRLSASWGGQAQDQEHPQPLARALRRRKLFSRFIPSGLNGSGCDAIPRVSTKPVVYFGRVLCWSLCANSCFSNCKSLSLLRSADSLNCNHLFCNICTMKSMKSGSICPVYKIPYRRRGTGYGS